MILPPPPDSFIDLCGVKARPAVRRHRSRAWISGLPCGGVREPGADTPPAMDGKDICSASGQTEDLRDPRRQRRRRGPIVTMDAMCAQHETARRLPGRCAGYVVTAVKENRETVLDDLRAIDFKDAPWFGTFEKGHGRIERRRCAAAGLSGPTQAAPLSTATAKLSASSANAGSSRPGSAASKRPGALLRPVPNAPDPRSFRRARHMPRSLSCLTNAAVAIARRGGRFSCMPAADRHYAARDPYALNAILITPGG